MPSISREESKKMNEQAEKTLNVWSSSAETLLIRTLATKSELTGSMLRRRIMEDSKSFDDTISEPQWLLGPAKDALNDVVEVSAQLDKAITHAQSEFPAEYLCQVTECSPSDFRQILITERS